MTSAVYKNLRYNLIVNILDGGFFGFALGFASFTTIIPLFVSTMTDSAILIGLIPAIHSVGWQLPQLLTAHSVARRRRYKPMVLWFTIQERIPFIGLALAAFLLPHIGKSTGLTLTFIFLIWQGLGAGLTAAPWQSMIGRIIPSDLRGTFYGAQSAAANLLASVGAIAAGIILQRLASPLDFALCFLLATGNMAVSWVLLSRAREPEDAPITPQVESADFWKSLGQILRRDVNFRWFLVVRLLSQVATMGSAFYTVYAVRHHGMSEVGVGLMTGVLLGAQIGANLLMGWIGDRWGHRLAMQITVFAAVGSALIAWWAPGPGWFFLAFALAGAANVVWTVSLAMILEFGAEAERPAYIGLGNTLVAPMTILAPFIGGWLAESAGYPAAFLASVIGGLATAAVLHFQVRDPRSLSPPVAELGLTD